MANIEALDKIWKGKGWSDGERVTRVAQTDGTIAEGMAALMYGWSSSSGTFTKLLVDPSGALVATGTPTPTQVVPSNVSVSTPGVRVQLPSVACKSVTVKAMAQNTGLVYVGDGSVTSGNGFQLSPGDSVSVDIDNVNRLWIDAAVANEGVTMLAVN